MSNKAILVVASFLAGLMLGCSALINSDIGFIIGFLGLVCGIFLFAINLYEEMD